MQALWEQTANRPAFESLNHDIQTGVLIIGGGMAGILCAYMLQQAGVPYVLAEAQTICGKTTQNTTAKITFQHGLIYHTLIRRFGLEKAALYLKAHQTALEQYRALCRNIDCDFEEKDAYVYTLNNRQKIENELLALEKLGVHASFAQNLPLPFAQWRPLPRTVCRPGLSAVCRLCR